MCEKVDFIIIVGLKVVDVCKYVLRFCGKYVFELILGVFEYLSGVC